MEFNPVALDAKHRHLDAIHADAERCLLYTSDAADE